MKATGRNSLHLDWLKKEKEKNGINALNPVIVLHVMA